MVAQSPRNDDRRAEQIAGVVDRLAGVDADAKLEPIRLRAHRALHRRRAGDGLVRAREGDHQPVAEALDLAASVTVDRVAKNGEVGAADPVGVVVAEGGEQRRRADEVGEQDREDLRLLCHEAILDPVWPLQLTRIAARPGARRWAALGVQ